MEVTARLSPPSSEFSYYHLPRTPVAQRTHLEDTLPSHADPPQVAYPGSMPLYGAYAPAQVPPSHFYHPAGSQVAVQGTTPGGQPATFLMPMQFFPPGMGGYAAVSMPTSPQRPGGPGGAAGAAPNGVVPYPLAMAAAPGSSFGQPLPAAQYQAQYQNMIGYFQGMGMQDTGMGAAGAAGAPYAHPAYHHHHHHASPGGALDSRRRATPPRNPARGPPGGSLGNVLAELNARDMEGAAKFATAAAAAASLSSQARPTVAHSSLLEEHKALVAAGDSKQLHALPLRALHGHLVAFSRDQIGSRTVQLAVGAAPQEDVDAAFEELKPHLPDLMADVFANYGELCTPVGACCCRKEEHLTWRGSWQSILLLFMLLFSSASHPTSLPPSHHRSRSCPAVLGGRRRARSRRGGRSPRGSHPPALPPHLRLPSGAEGFGGVRPRAPPCHCLHSRAPHAALCR